MNTVKPWHEFARVSSDLAAVGAQLLYQDAEIASAYLATVAPDQGPRVHPISPVLAAGHLWFFIVNMSPKYRDLKRNQLFALHTLPTVMGGEEFYARGRAEEVDDAQTRHDICNATKQRQGGSHFEALFRCELSSVLYTKWDNWGTAQAWPRHVKWRSDTH